VEVLLTAGSCCCCCGLHDLPGSAGVVVGGAELGPLANGTAVLVASRKSDGHPANADSVVVRREEGIRASIVGLDLGATRLGALVARVAVVGLEVEVSADLVEAADVGYFASGVSELAAAAWGLGALQSDAEVDLVDGGVGCREEVLDEGEDGQDA
jgi:hypothetical protein